MNMNRKIKHVTEGKPNKGQRLGKSFTHSPDYGCWALAPAAAAE